ncbi:hypothetical protein [Sphingorhabdus sp.]|uniref:hypothetical protein n=1 Tax=Sphingorhabdus sp. TaxID=1902408 RepID=UPI0035930F87
MIVVLGVLIALGLGAFAEWANWQSKVADGEERLKEEFKRNTNYAIEQIAVSSCVTAQLDALSERLRKSGSRLDPAPTFIRARTPDIAIVFVTPRRPSESQIWQSLQQDGTLSHFPAYRQRKLSEAYTALDIRSGLVREMRGLQPQLDVLSENIELDPATKIKLLGLLHQAKGNVSSNRLVSKQFAIEAIDSGMASVDVAADVLQKAAAGSAVSFCRERGLPLVDWRNEIEAERRNMALGEKVKPEAH